MQLEQISMDRNDARKAFLEYRHAVRERHDREDEQIMRGYRAMAQGHQLVRLSETMRVGGTRELTFSIRQWNGRREPCDYRVPRLAVCRADAKVCFTFGVDEDGGCLFTADRRERDLGPGNKRDRSRIADDTFEPFHRATRSNRTVLRAIVPSVPPPLRPVHALSGYQILWEAEWAPDPAPPVDPALLKHIGGDLYAVVAIWDLTELERAVLAARAEA